MPWQVHGDVVDRCDGRVGVASRQHTTTRTTTAGTGSGLQQRGGPQEARQARQDRVFVGGVDVS